jgi:pimeloyl-ACP methyl ester carboxylesterase
MPIFTGDDSAQLHYDVLDRTPGQSGPLVVLAGGAARHPAYLGDLGGLDTAYPLVVPHLRGVGETPMPADPTRGSFWRQAEDVERLREHLGLDRLLLAGHSAGSRIAVSYAVQFPDRVAALVLITPPTAYLVEVEPDSDDLVGSRMRDPVFAAAAAAMDVDVSDGTEETFDKWQLSVAPVGYAAWGTAERAHAAEGTYSFEAAKAFFSVEPPPDVRERLGRIRAPVLVVGGAQDVMLGVAPLRALAELCPLGRLAVIEGSAHYPFVEAPDDFAEIVREFLDKAVDVGQGLGA